MSKAKTMVKLMALYYISNCNIYIYFKNISEIKMLKYRIINNNKCI